MIDQALPIDGILPQLVDTLNNHPAVIVRAPTGSGKTTRVPPAILESGLLQSGKLLMLQPRRVAARACASAMARGYGQSPGETVGYRIRFEKRDSSKTRILVVTEGILTRRFVSDPMLDGVSCVVLDEFHERSRHTDLALAFLRELLEIRDDLKVVVMSATLDAEPVSRYLFDCPVLDTHGRAFPLEIQYLPMPMQQRLPQQIEAGLDQILKDPADDGGNILVFLPGAPEIRWTRDHLSHKNYPADVMPLHGSLSSREQDAVLTPGKRRRIILSTNIAETSLTIEGVTAVVDCGYRKALFHDPNRGFDRLDMVRISKAGADQRAGRAGRTAPGRVIRLWDENRHLMLDAHDPPEIATADLASMMLEILDFHGPDLDSFPFFEAPPPESRNRALALLRMLGALTSEHRLTTKGKHLNQLPLHPRMACIMEQAARDGLLRQGSSICALLSEKPAGNMDFPEQLSLIENNGPYNNEIDQRLLSRVRDVRYQLLKQARRLWPDAIKDGRAKPHDLARLLLAGYPDRICQVRSPGMGVMVGGRGVVFEAREPADFKYFLALELVEGGKSRTAGKARRIVPIELEDIRKTVQTRQTSIAVFDSRREAVAGVRQTIFEDLVLEEKTGVEVDAYKLENVLAREAREQFERIFKPDKKAKALLMRLRFAAQHLPEEDWPDYSREGLEALLPELCMGLRRFDDLRKLNWTNVLLERLPWPLRRVLDTEAPERMEVPSGSKIVIDYQPAFEAAGYPVLAVRLQELFGLADTPAVARGRVPLLCHLLAPNMRPCQVTRDLRSFWDNTYAEVRKELRQRYPKHSWPEDPWQAKPMRGARRRSV